MQRVNSKQPIEPHHLPERLQGQFAELKAKLWRAELALCGVWCVFACLFSFLCVFVLDRWQDTPSMVRGVLLLGALTIMGLAIGWWGWRWLIAERNLRDYSRLVQRRYRILGDRLLGIVELTEDSSDETNYSEELYEAAVQQVDADAKKLQFHPGHLPHMASQTGFHIHTSCRSIPHLARPPAGSFLKRPQQMDQPGWSHSPLYTCHGGAVDGGTPHHPG